MKLFLCPKGIFYAEEAALDFEDGCKISSIRTFGYVSVSWACYLVDYEEDRGIVEL